MPMMVQTSTDDAPELLALIERRRAHGLDRHDEWWEGVYRIVTNPSPEHQRLVYALSKLLESRLLEPDAEVIPGVNIGSDKEDARVPDVAIVRFGTPRTSTAFLATALLVVEILSPGERPGEKLPFYARWNVHEYVEIDPVGGTVELLANRDGTWTAVDRSSIVDVVVSELVDLISTG
jgi:Uma2 family endonuclease